MHGLCFWKSSVSDASYGQYLKYEQYVICHVGNSGNINTDIIEVYIVSDAGKSDRMLGYVSISAII